METERGGEWTHMEVAGMDREEVCSFCLWRHTVTLGVGGGGGGGRWEGLEEGQLTEEERGREVAGGLGGGGGGQAGSSSV